MSRAQQSSIRSFFQPRPQPDYAAPPSSAPSPRTLNNEPDAPRLTTTPPAPPPTVPSQQPPPSQSVAIQVTLPPNGVPIPPSPPSLPAGATIVALAEQHIPALRRINSLLLPVAYPDSFYTKALDPLASGLFSRAILWQDSDNDAPKVVGGLICRLEPNPFLDAQGQPLLRLPPPQNKTKSTEPPFITPYFAIYIQSLVLLSPYRSLGLAAAALEHIIASAALLPAAGSNIDTRTIHAHVWTENEEGLKWYEARGFAREGREPVKGYYFKLRPDTAWVVRRHIGPSSASTPRPLLPKAAAPMASPSPATATPSANGTVLAAAINLPTPTSTSTPPPPTTTRGPPRRPSAAPTAPRSASALSFQNARPDTEWNDLPAEMVMPGRNGVCSSSSSSSIQQQLLPPPAPADEGRSGGVPGSGASSRSNSTAAAGRKRRERAYPTAAFGK
ncbi:hypothetical protein BT67DRAFT_454621 [Trichocladium antarcticum]|uniref:N-acetyltransferase domain-containing protein n=1 Tax=Trichocladium antarcticum TaxID=1450529 RepID=A0AAN6UPZ0_9PEZI|nr:hypothetical protein BT67DRAFT_454621 [Trichocladium antarcticum]